MQKKDVLLINYTGRKGGGPLDAFEMAKALCDRMPVVAVLSDQIENLQLWKKLHLEELILIPTYHNAREALIESLFWKKQRKTILSKTGKINVKYIYCPMGTFWSEKINNLFPKAKKGIVIHDPKPHSGERFLGMFNMHYEKYDYLFVHSKKFVSYVNERYKKPTFYLQLGRHDIYKYCENKKQVIKYDPDKINYLFFGRISEYKGLNILGEAFKTVQHKLRENVTLSIIGAGDFSPYLKEYESLKNVTIINRWIKDEETESAFTGKNVICVCPYLDATQSGVVLVAMAYGVPVIATKTGGMEEQIDNGDTGLLVKPGDANDLAEAMTKLATDRKLFDHIVEGEEKVNKQTGWEITATQLIKDMNVSL